METQKKLISGILIGGAVGIIAGLLLAPTTGKEMRETIAKKSGSMKDSLIDTITDSLESIKSSFNNKIDEIANQTKDTVDSAADKLSNKVKSA
jgi:gas vesicle protein